MKQFVTALEKAAATSQYTAPHCRFDSFAPIRFNVAAQWLVDGVRLFYLLWHHDPLNSRFVQRDYFWNLSRALLLATESIYIHGWWISPGKLSLTPNKAFKFVSGIASALLP